MAQQVVAYPSPPLNIVKCMNNKVERLIKASSHLSCFNTIPFKHLISNCSLSVNKPNLLVKCGHSPDYFQPSTPRFSPTSSTPSSGSSAKIFVGHSIYKGKAALTVDPRMPEFLPLDSGALKISREGYVLLQFAPAAALRQYDWTRKQVFSLSVAEIGTLISLGARDSCEFFHDPNKGKSDEGKVRKVLKVEPLPDGSGHFFNLSVQNKLVNVDESIYIPITKGEFAVLISGFNFILPYLIGWHAYAESLKPEAMIRANNTRGTGTVDYEWNR